MSRSKLLLLISSAFIVSSALAENQHPETTESNNVSWIIAASLGSSWVDIGKTQTLYLTPDIEKTYKSTRSSDTSLTGELFLAVQYYFSTQWRSQLGLSLTDAQNLGLKGEIWDDADPQFNNYRYQYQIRHRGLALKAKLLFDAAYGLSPWVSAGLGAGFNRAHSFSNQPVIAQALPNNNFSSNSKTSFSYSLGLGIQKKLNPHWEIGVGYEFADWGKSSLGRAAGQTSSHGPALNHLYANGFLFNITYLA